MKKILLTLLSVLMLIGLTTTSVTADTEEISELEFNADFDNINWFNPLSFITIDPNTNINFGDNWFCVVYFQGKNGTIFNYYSKDGKWRKGSSVYDEPIGEDWPDYMDDINSLTNVRYQFHYSVANAGYTLGQGFSVKFNGESLGMGTNVDTYYSTENNQSAIDVNHNIKKPVLVPKQTILSYEVGSSYNWSVPQNVSIKGEETNFKVSLSDAKFLFGQGLKITVDSYYNFYLSGDEKVAYTLSLDHGDTPIEDGGEIFTSSEDIEQDVYVNLSELPTLPGEYSDCLTFSASVVMVPIEGPQ